MRLLIKCGLGLSLCIAGLAWAQIPAPGYPQKTVRFVNNFPPGGPSDILARSVAEALQGSLKQSFIVENKVGAGGNVGADAVAKSAADGYTVLFGIDTAFTVNPHIYKALPFKPQDLKPVLVMGSSGLLVGAHPATGIKSLRDLVTTGKAKTLNFSSGGNGSPGHLAVEVFMDAAGVKIQHVPYKGNTPAVTAVVAGEVDAYIGVLSGSIPMIDAGKLKVLAYVNARPSFKPDPKVPLVAEVVPKFENPLYWVGYFGPARLPDPVLRRLNSEYVRALRSEEFRPKFEAQNNPVVANTPEEFSAMLYADLDRVARIVKGAGINPE